MEELTGLRLGNYEIGERIGRGGMGSVYRSRQISLNRTVAVKVIEPGLAGRAEFMARFQREVAALATLSHPRILSVFDFGDQDGMAYMVIPYIGGGNLRHVIDRSAPLPLNTIARLLDQIAEGLDYIHGQGVIHRDLKPENLLIDETKQGMNVYISDFGIAKLNSDATDITGEGVLVGVPAYMSPERWRGEPLDQTSDLYALGVILFEMLTGQKPFIADDVLGLMRMHMFDAVPSVRSVQPELPAKLDAMLTKALAKSPADRYQSGAEFAAAFHQAINGAMSRGLPAVPPSAAPYVPVPQAAPPRPIAPGGFGSASGGVSPITSTFEQPRSMPYPAQSSPKRSTTNPLIILIVISVVGVLGILIASGRVNPPEIALLSGLGAFAVFVVLPVYRLIQTRRDQSDHKSTVIEPTKKSAITDTAIADQVKAEAVTPIDLRKPKPIDESPLDFKEVAIEAGPIAPPPLPRPIEPPMREESIAPPIPVRKLTLFDMHEGQIIAGNYELIKRLDKGENSRVYHARDLKRRREVAIKLLSPSSDPKRQRRFEQEAELLGKLHHPHIIAFYDYDTFEGISYMVMPILSGGTLRDRIKEKLPELPTVIDLTDQLTDALDYIHEQGIVHRDLKASNVLLDNRDQAYLGDFGIAKVLNPEENLNLTVVGMPIGSASYMAPEQWMGVGVTPASDQYSLGVLAYQMLTGNLPIEAPNLYKAAYEVPRPLRDFRPDLPTALDPVLQKVLSKRPNDRYPSVRGFAQALESAIVNKPTEREPLTMPILTTPPPTPTMTTEPTAIRHVFISYSSTDGAYADSLADFLLDKGFNVWIARQINYGADFWETIMKSIQACGAVILLMTPDGEKSQWVQREIDCAERYKKPILTLLRDGDNFALFWRRHYVDVKDGRMPPDEFLNALAAQSPRGGGRGVAVRL